MEKSKYELESNDHAQIKPYLIASKTVVKDLVDLIKNKEDKKLKINAFPLIHLQGGYQSFDSISGQINQGGIGARIGAYYTRKVYFEINHIQYNGLYSYNLQKKIEEDNVIPSDGYAFAGTNNNYFSKNTTGYISYSPNDIFNFQIGHGRNFFGNGYRSFMLSDYANDYSYAKISTTIWKLKYVNLFSNYKDVQETRRGFYSSFDNKFSAIHFLSWNLSKRINLSFFEAVVWKGKDSLVTRNFDVNYLNPLVFYRPVEYSIGSSDNSLMGLDGRYKLSNKLSLYGQIVIDEFLLNELKKDFYRRIGKNNTNDWGWVHNKYAGQLGFKCFDVFKDGISIQSEFNFARPYIYGHINRFMNYGHFNQPLAHPFGSNFYEGVFILNYAKERWNFLAKTLVNKGGFNIDDSNFGSNVYTPYLTYEQRYGNVIGQGNNYQIIHSELRASYFLSFKQNLIAEASIVNRDYKDLYSKSNDFYFTIGVKTSLGNNYNEF